ncbi:MAG: hypothetical protein AAGF99_14225 [Bacteroidota bacterium]
MPDPPPPAMSQRKWDWRPKLRWFAAEYFIVVLGVLTAVGINAWWQGRQNATREQVYLLQLVEDLRETERIMTERDARMDALTGGAVERLIVSFGLPERPPRDSVEAWLANVGYFATPRPVLGTVEALMASGDFGAIQDDALVSAIVAYYDVTREYVDDQLRQVDQGGIQREAIRIRHLGELAVYRPEFDAQDSDEGTTDLITVPEEWATPFPLDLDAFYSDPVVFRRLVILRWYVELTAGSRRVMRQSAADLREQVEAELNR